MIKNFLYSLFIHLFIAVALYYGFYRDNENIVKSKEIKLEMSFADFGKAISASDIVATNELKKEQENRAEKSDRKQDSQRQEKAEIQKQEKQNNDFGKNLPKKTSEEKVQSIPNQEDNAKSVKEETKKAKTKKQASDSEVVKNTKSTTLPENKVPNGSNIVSNAGPEKNQNLQKAPLAEEKSQQNSAKDEKAQKISEQNPIKKPEISSEKKPIEQINKDSSSDKIFNNLAFDAKNFVQNKSISGTDEGNDLSAYEKLNIQSQIRFCYRRAVQESRLDSKLKLFIKINISKEGFIDNDFEKSIDKAKYDDVSQKDYKIAIDNIRRALQLCSPLRNLPIAKYEIWQEVVLQFDPMASE